MRGRALLVGVVGSMIGLFLSTPQPASACGVKAVGVGSTVAYSGAKGETAGQMVVYGNTEVNRRLALAIKSAGHRVKRSKQVGKADVVLTNITLASAVQQNLKGSKTVVVVILAAGETAPDGVRYAVRITDRVNEQLATVERALRESKGV